MDALERRIISLLSDMELTVSKLYKVYAKKYPEHSDFWSNLVKEEENHAKLIKSIGGYIERKEARLNKKKCKEDSIEAVLNYVRGNIEKAESYNIPFRDVLFTASQIEKNIIERNFCSLFESNHPECNKVHEIINWETTQHANRIKELLEDLTPE